MPTPAKIRSSSVGLTFDGLFVTGFTVDGLPSLSDSVNDAAVFTVAEQSKHLQASKRYQSVILPLTYVAQECLFRQLNVGDSFDFISGTRFDSFFLTCKKVSTRCYVDSKGQRHEVGSIKAKVYHVVRC